jgi:deoxyribodipyrimidine photo-lyase
MSSRNPTIVWFRGDLRIADHAALAAAADRGGPVIPVFVWAPHEAGTWAPGAASRWWLHHSLSAVADQLQALHSRLIIRQGDSLDELRSIIRSTRADAVFCNRVYEPALVQRDRKVAAQLEADGISFASFNGGLLFEPWDVATQQGTPFQVYTAFWRATGERLEPSAPVAAPKRLDTPGRWPASAALTDLALLPTIDWAVAFRDHWQPGAAGGAAALRAFLEDGLGRYDADRNRPDIRGSSRLSPHLHFGEISPRTVWHAVTDRLAGSSGRSFAKAAEVYKKELVWREFAHHLLHHFPHTVDRPLREEFDLFPWAEDEEQLGAWQRGETGYPIVDAGMRELWTTGWMHNRVRMIVASFLVKDMLIPWQDGARWFWDTLVDADLANNTLGWQWTAGCGADAAPYFRVFNPILQGERFDPDGEYVRRWLPELRALPNRLIHKPWEASAGVLRDADVALGETYPEPIVDHNEARRQALSAFEQLKQTRRKRPRMAGTAS